jgi:hypothetical protein
MRDLAGSNDLTLTLVGLAHLFSKFLNVAIGFGLGFVAADNFSRPCVRHPCSLSTHFEPVRKQVQR